MNEYVIGVDLGGTNIRSAAVTNTGQILKRDKRSTEVPKGKETVVTNILQSIEAVREKASEVSLKGIGIGVPGVIFFKKGIVSQSPNFPDWINYNVKKRIEQDIAVPVFIENDANAAAIGEGWLGAARGHESFCMLTLGTGLGGGIVLDKKLWHGMDGMGGEIGHIIVEPEGVPCGCGGRGCLEQYTSATAIKRRAIEGFMKPQAAALKEVCNNNPDTISAKILFDLARQGDPFSKQLYIDMGRYLGIGIVSLIHLFNLDLIVIGGGAADAWEFFIEQVKKEIKERAYKIPGERMVIKKAECGDDAGILGAAAIAFQQ